MVRISESVEISEEEYLAIQLSGIERFLRGSRKAGIITLIYDNNNTSSLEDFSRSAASRFVYNPDTDSKEFKEWKRFIESHVEKELIHTVYDIKRYMETGNWICEPSGKDEKVGSTVDLVIGLKRIFGHSDGIFSRFKNMLLRK